MKRYKLQSAEFVYAPGLIAWAINGAKFPKDRDQMAKVISATWNLTAEIGMGIVMETIPYTIDGETVIIEVESDDATV